MNNPLINDAAQRDGSNKKQARLALSKGRTDAHGGHSGAAGYHTHDKDGKEVKVDQTEFKKTKRQLDKYNAKINKIERKFLHTKSKQGKERLNKELKGMKSIRDIYTRKLDRMMKGEKLTQTYGAKPKPTKKSIDLKRLQIDKLGETLQQTSDWEAADKLLKQMTDLRKEVNEYEKQNS